MATHLHDPFRLELRPEPEPVDGELPPPICLVDEEGPYPQNHPLWMRSLAALVAALFAAAIILMAFAQRPNQIVSVFSASTEPSSPM